MLQTRPLWFLFNLAVKWFLWNWSTESSPSTKSSITPELLCWTEVDHSHEVIKCKVTSSRKYLRTEQTDQSAFLRWCGEEQFSLSQLIFPQLSQRLKKADKLRIRDEITKIPVKPSFAIVSLTLSELTSQRSPAPSSHHFQRKPHDLCLPGFWQQHPAGAPGCQDIAPSPMPNMVIVPWPLLSCLKGEDVRLLGGEGS